MNQAVYKDTVGQKISLEERKRLEQQEYDRIYAADSEISSEEVRRSFLAASENRFVALLRRFATGARVLEIGCGTGQHSILAARCGAKSVLGVDISPEAVKAASRNADALGLTSSTRFEVLDIEALPFEAGSFDLVINHEVFSSIDLTKVLPELSRVLRPGGKLLIIECFGHNPIFNLNREISARRGRRTRWAVDHIFKAQDLVLCERFFKTSSFNYFHLLAVYVAPLRRLLPKSLHLALAHLIDTLDHVLLSLPLIKRFAFKVVGEFEKK